MSAKRGRYSVRQKSNGLYGVYDGYLADFCTLWEDDGTPLPLEWRTRESAQTWLGECRMAWLYGRAPEPEGAGAVRVTRMVRDGWGAVPEERWE